MHSIGSTLVVATLVANKNLHSPSTLGTPNGVRKLPSNVRNLEVGATVRGPHDLLVILLKRHLEPLLHHHLPPLLELSHSLQHRRSVAAQHHGRPLAQQGPPRFVLVRQHLLHLLRHRVHGVVGLGHEQALYAAPESV